MAAGEHLIDFSFDERAEQALDFIESIKTMQTEDTAPLLLVDIDAIQILVEKMREGGENGRTAEACLERGAVYGVSAALALAIPTAVLGPMGATAAVVTAGKWVLGLAPAASAGVGILKDSQNQDVLERILRELEEYKDYLTNVTINPAYDPGPHYRNHPSLIHLSLFTMSRYATAATGQACTFFGSQTETGLAAPSEDGSADIDGRPRSESSSAVLGVDPTAKPPSAAEREGSFTGP